MKLEPGVYFNLLRDGRPLQVLQTEEIKGCFWLTYNALPVNTNLVVTVSSASALSRVFQNLLRTRSIFYLLRLIWLLRFLTHDSCQRDATYHIVSCVSGYFKAVNEHESVKWENISALPCRVPSSRKSLNKKKAQNLPECRILRSCADEETLQLFEHRSEI